MAINNTVEQEVRKTMGLLDNLPELKAHYLFRAHLMERIEEEKPQTAVGRYVANYGMQLALIVFLFLINIGSVIALTRSNDSEPMLGKHQLIESMTNEYSSPTLSCYLDNSGLAETND